MNLSNDDDMSIFRNQETQLTHTKSCIISFFFFFFNLYNMTNLPDYYKILGVSPTASQEEIREGKIITIKKSCHFVSNFISLQEGSSFKSSR